jgi:hypothetical protein
MVFLVNVRVSRRMSARRDVIEVVGIDGVVDFDCTEVDNEREKLRMCVLDELALRGIVGAIVGSGRQCSRHLAWDCQGVWVCGRY